MENKIIKKLKIYYFFKNYLFKLFITTYIYFLNEKRKFNFIFKKLNKIII